MARRDPLIGNLCSVIAAASGVRPVAVIFDMDGTLCDVRSIRHHLEADPATGKKRNFHAFHSASMECPPHPQVATLAREVSAAGARIVITTAREARWSFHTALWLRDREITYDAMLMRDNGDFRPDAEVKRSLIPQLLARYSPVAAIDDRDDIIEVWRESGISTVKAHDDGVIDRLTLPPALDALLEFAR